MTIEDRFWAKVDTTGDCWEWLAYRNRDGYGQFGVRAGLTVMAHRLAYEILVGPIADGLTVDHLCRNRACVNPAHLEPVTNRVNVMRGEGLPVLHAAKTHCANGHLFDAENTYVWRGQRDCRACNRAHDAVRRRRSSTAA